MMTTTLIIDKLSNIADNKNLLLQPVEVVEFTKHSICIQTKVNMAAGHSLQLNGKLIVAGKYEEFKATAVLKVVTPLDSKLKKFELQLNQFDKIQWERFFKSINSKQERADTIFSKMSGGD